MGDRRFRRSRMDRAAALPRRLCRAVLVAAAMLIALPVAADYWYEHYARAERALADQDWSQAVQELQEALARKGDSGARVRSYGMKVIAYFPYLKLGIAYYNLGQLEAAFQAFQTEEQLGAIQGSDEAMAELDRYRSMTLEAKRTAAEAEIERIAQLVRESLREAEILERQGRPQAAMDALAEGLAVDPENSDATEMMSRLRTEVVRRERDRQDEQRATDLISRGRAALEGGGYAEAASLFRQALSVRPGGEAERLLGEAQAGLREELQAQRDSEARRSMIERGIEEARTLESANRFSEALDRLQTVLAADSANADALAIQDRILQDQKNAARLDSISGELTKAKAELAAGRYEGAISAANRALAQDPGNADALDVVRSAYQEISRRLLGSRKVENIPPAIRFADLRQEQADGSRAQIVQNPVFHLGGVVIDNSPVEIRFAGPGDRELDGVSTSQPVGDYYITEFSVEDRIAAGHVTYQLVATDSAGLTSSAEYSVVYEPPLYRSLWFRAAVFLVPILVIAGIWVERSRRRRQLVRRRFNPYIAGAPVLDRKLFFGREQLVEQILQTIHNNSLLLYGERRIGKTSLQHNLRKRLTLLEDPEYDFYPVYIDLQGTPEERFFATLAEDIFQQLAPVLADLQPSHLISEGSAYGYRELVHDLRSVLQVLEGRSPKKVKLVLLIDEVDELNAYDPRINQKLRSLFMKSFAENLVAVVSGVAIRKQWEKEGSPWYNFFEEIEVKAIGREDAEALITRPVENIFKFDAGVVDRIIQLSECKPYRIQRLCIAIVNRLHEHGRRTITIEDVEAVGRSTAS